MEKKLVQKYWMYRKNRVRNDTLFFYSHGGTDFAGNMFRIAECFLKGKYGEKKINVVVKNGNTLPINFLLLKQEFPKANLRIVYEGTEECIKALAISKYLFTDNNMPIYFWKRDEQILLQTWHGTPLKKIGFDYFEDIVYTGNQKRAFTTADYILFPNKYTESHMINSYRMHNELSPDNKIIVGGYPRNAIFFDKSLSKRVKKKYGIEDKIVSVYMPTWRGSLKNQNEIFGQTTIIEQYLAELDEELPPNHEVFVKLHRLDAEGIDFTKYNKIKSFPQDIETYEFIACADNLITDYSSVMFDFLCTRKKIVLFTYDLASYMARQGMYFNINKLPFPQVNSIKQLVNELTSPKNYDDESIFEEFCGNDGPLAVENICDILTGSESPSCDEQMKSQAPKPNILLYCGALNNNKTTLDFYNYIDQLDLDSNNYFLMYLNTNFIKNPIKIQGIPKAIELVSIDKYKDESVFYVGDYPQKEDWQKAFSRLFPHISFDKVIRFGGMDLDTLYLLGFAPIKEKIFLYYPPMESNSFFVEFERNNSNNENFRFFHVINRLENVSPSCSYQMVAPRKIPQNMENTTLSIMVKNIAEQAAIQYSKKGDVCKPKNIEACNNDQLNKLKSQLANANKRIDVLQFQRDQYFDAYNNTISSTSWKVTTPIRKLLDAIRNIKNVRG